VFLINVPVAVIALMAALTWIPRDPPQPAPKNAREITSRIDLTGIIGFTVTMTALGVSIPAVALSVLHRKPSAQVDQPANLKKERRYRTHVQPPRPRASQPPRRPPHPRLGAP
jgi:hypothetical protein